MNYTSDRLPLPHRFGRRVAEGTPTFEEAVGRVLAIHGAARKAGGRTAENWQTTLRQYAYPSLGGKGVATVCASEAWVGLKLVFEFLVLTAARSAEARLATWDEIDLDTLVWTVPAARTKAGRGCDLAPRLP